MREDDPGLRAWSHFLGAHALALRAVEARLKAAGQPPLAWYDVLLELDRAGGRLRIGELGERLVVAPYNMTRLVDRLEKEKLLKRARVEGDGRGASVELTTRVRKCGARCGRTTARRSGRCSWMRSTKPTRRMWCER